jgi:hypothetical protein
MEQSGGMEMSDEMEMGEKDRDEIGCGYMYTMKGCMIKRWLSGIEQIMLVHKSNS